MRSDNSPDTTRLRSRHNYQAMMNAMADPLYVCNQHYRVVYANRAMREMTESEPEETVCYRSIFGRDAPCPWCRMNTTDAGKNVSFEIQSEYHERHFHVSTTMLTHDDGSSSWMNILRDITNEKHLQQQLHHAHKLEAIGQLAGGVAHDFNNVLGALVGYAEMIRNNNLGPDTTPIDAKLHRRINMILDASMRSSQLVKKLLSFSRKGTYQFRPLDAHRIIDECIAMLSHTIDKRIRITTQLDADSHFVHADSEYLENALLNIALNARDAMPEGGTLTFATSGVSVDSASNTELSPHLADGEYCMLRISDTGTGIPSHIIDKIFDPFFTTKSREKGTGLGLSGVYGCIKAHKGHIEVRSSPGEGSSFLLYIPLARESTKEEAFQAVETTSAGNEGTVLIIDDEEWIREITGDMLVNMGYKAVTFESCHKALEYYKGAVDTVSLIILDMIMPEATGNECLEKIQHISPDARVLITTGYSVSRKANEALENGARGLLPKPFTQTQLAQMVAEALA